MVGNVQELDVLGRRAFDAAVPLGKAAGSSGWPSLAKGEEECFGAASVTAEPLAEGLTVEATVKWFNAEKGYGFVALTGGGGDAFLHLKILRQIGRESLPSGVKITIVVRAGPRGAEVARVVKVEATGAVERPERSARRAPDPSTAFDLTGKVKWFDGARGFGFVASDDFGRDVFVHSSTLGASRVAGLSEGQAVSMRVVETPKGREAIAIVV